MNKEHNWTECGLNADWIYRAWHYGTNKPNLTDGDYYVFENEDDGKYLVLRSYPSREEDCVTTIASFPTKAEAMAMVERNDTQELKVSEFCAGKTPDQIVKAILELGNYQWHASVRVIQDKLGVSSGDNACYHLNGDSLNRFEKLQFAWMTYYASREIVDFIEEYKGIGDEKRIDAIQKAIWHAFPYSPKA
jgi:hypothetical protein